MDEKIDSLNSYQALAMSVRLPSATPEYAILGLLGEAGEVAGLCAKAVRDGKLFSHDQMIKKELGDVLWFVAAIASDHGFTLSDIAQGNIYKLFDRRDRGVLQGSGDER